MARSKKTRSIDSYFSRDTDHDLALRELTAHTQVSEPNEQWREHSSKRSDPELDEQILTLAQLGNTIDATSILVKRRGYTTTEARHFVDELIGLKA